MPSVFRNDRANRQRFRRGTSAMLLAAYLLTAAGVPLPAGSKPTSTTELFACATSNCGCKTAEQCWQSCCCHTLAERIAWARKHGVRPPEFAIAEARSAGFDLSWLENPSNAVLACKADNCCTTEKDPAPRSCCETGTKTTPAKIAHACCSHDSKSQTVQGADTSTSTILVWQAFKCKGQSMNWLAAVRQLIVVRPFDCQTLPVVAWLGPAPSDHAVVASDDPAVPPPERA
jgi:hypothetical protein